MGAAKGNQAPTVAQRAVADLEKYRGKRELLRHERGTQAYVDLYFHPEVDGSPIAACRFLGYNVGSKSTFREIWTMAGLPIKRASPAAKMAETRANVAVAGSGLDPQSIERYYLELTGQQEEAVLVDWGIPRSQEFATLACISDLHYGDACMDLRKWLAMRDWLAADKSRKFVLLGDILNTATKSSISSPDALAFEQARDLLIYHLAPIAKQCIVALAGNHEGRVSKETGLRICPTQEICKELGITYGGRSKFVRLNVHRGAKEQVYDGYLHHGWGRARTPGAKVNSLFQMMAGLEVDFFAMGHLHDRYIAEVLRMGIGKTVADENGENHAYITINEHPLAICGHYLRWRPDGYARDLGMAPTATGSVSLHFYPDKHSVHGRK